MKKIKSLLNCILIIDLIQKKIAYCIHIALYYKSIIYTKNVKQFAKVLKSFINYKGFCNHSKKCIN